MASTAIRHVFYRPEKRELSVWFAGSGRRYKYFDVPPELHAELVSAESRGRFFNEAIKGHFECTRIDEEPRRPRTAA